MRRWGLALFGVLCAGPLLIYSCREPTQITVDLTTDLPCVGLPDDAGATRPPVPGVFSGDGRVALWVAADTPSPVPQVIARSCAQGASTAHVGTIAIVPSKSNDDRVVITAAINVRDPSKSDVCPGDPPSPDCIVARRTVGFIPHTPLTLPIHLALACAGVVCKKGETCENGTCVSDVVTCTSDSPTCVGPTDAGPPDAAVEAGPVEAGACDGGGLGNALNCGKCGLPCDGICLGDACQIPKTNPLSQVADEGCVAVDGRQVFWSAATAGVGAVYWAPRAGFAVTALEKQLPVGPVAATPAGSGSASYVVRDAITVGTSFVRDVSSAPPVPVPNTMQAVKAPGTHDWLARGPFSRCATTWDGVSYAGVDCEFISWSTSASPRLVHLAVGKATYLAVRAGGDLVGGPTSNTQTIFSSALKVASVVGAVGGGDDYVVVSQVGLDFVLTKVTVDPNAILIKVAPAPFYKQQIAMTGLKIDGTTVYFADALHRIAKVDLNGLATQLATVVVPSGPNGLTTMRGRTCIDVDDVAVYYLVQGVPRRSPR